MADVFTIEITIRSSIPVSFNSGQCLLGRVQRFEVLGFLHFVFIGLNFLIEGAFLGGKFQTISERNTTKVGQVFV